MLCGPVLVFHTLVTLRNSRTPLLTILPVLVSNTNSFWSLHMHMPHNSTSQVLVYAVGIKMSLAGDQAAAPLPFFMTC